MFQSVFSAQHSFGLFNFEFILTNLFVKSIHFLPPKFDFGEFDFYLSALPFTVYAAEIFFNYY